MGRICGSVSWKDPFGKGQQPPISTLGGAWGHRQGARGTAGWHGPPGSGMPGSRAPVLGDRSLPAERSPTLPPSPGWRSVQDGASVPSASETMEHAVSNRDHMLGSQKQAKDPGNVLSACKILAKEF